MSRRRPEIAQFTIFFAEPVPVSAENGQAA